MLPLGVLHVLIHWQVYRLMQHTRGKLGDSTADLNHNSEHTINAGRAPLRGELIAQNMRGTAILCLKHKPIRLLAA
jgi:hypothetical protein